MCVFPEYRRIRSLAPAKINLGLHVLRRRADGYHAVETVLLPIGWHDRLTVQPADAFAFTCSDASLPVDERNLCVRAAHALADHVGIKAWGALHLEKNLPHGAGLGGGSSDAAHALRSLAELWQVDLPVADLHALAAGLGSDVPFFLHDEAMLATGRGDVLESLGAEPYRLPFALAVVMPPVQIATAEAYALIRPQGTDRPDLSAVVLSDDLGRWRRELVNDFEAPILARYPAIRAERERMLAAGAGYAALSGSGAAVFGVFEEEEAAQRVAHAAEAEGLRAWWEPAR